MGESPEAKVRSGSKRTLGSYHETHKGTDLEQLDSQLGSGQKPKVCTRVPAQMLVLKVHLERGMNRCMANLMTNDAELKLNCNTHS